MAKSGLRQSKFPSQLIDERRSSPTGAARLLSRLRILIKQADPDVVEEWKWRGRSGVVW